MAFGPCRTSNYVRIQVLDSTNLLKVKQHQISKIKIEI
jgi:hypothetical protein